MNSKFLIVIVGLIILSSVIFVAIWNNIPKECDDKCEHERRSIEAGSGAQSVFESPFREEHYSIEITGMKDLYRIGEQYDFSYIISGYGYQCGSKKVSFPDQNGEITKIFSSSSCIAGVPMEEFVFDIQKEYGTTFGHVELKNTGTYTVTVTFDRPNQYFPTTVSKEFRVMEK